MGTTAYDADFYRWATETAQALREGRLREVDVQHVSEELEDMGKRERRELRHRLTVLLAHLLKWQYQPEGRGTSGRATILEQRQQIAGLLEDSPSLRPPVSDWLAQAYGEAVAKAAAETGLAEQTFPVACPYRVEQVLDASFLPG
jgi:hypothetical protein